MSYDVFRTFMPGGSGHVALSQMVRSFVGAAFDFDLQVVLSSEEVPPCQLTEGARNWDGTPGCSAGRRRRM